MVVEEAIECIEKHMHRTNEYAMNAHAAHADNIEDNMQIHPIIKNTSPQV